MLPILFLQPRNTICGVLPSDSYLFLTVPWSSWQLPLCCSRQDVLHKLLSFNSLTAAQCAVVPNVRLEQGKLHLSCLEPRTLGKTSLWHSVICNVLVLYKGSTFQSVFGILTIGTVYPMLGICIFLLKDS